MNSVREEFKLRLPKLAANIALALVFGILGTISSLILSGVFEGAGFYSWLALTLVGGVFLVRALFDVLVISDKTIGLFLRRFGIQERWSKRRMAKDLVCIIAIILAVAAIFPFFETAGTAGTMLQIATTMAAIGVVLIFVYDVGRTLYQIFLKKANTVTDWLVHEPNEVAK